MARPSNPLATTAALAALLVTCAFYADVALGGGTFGARRGGAFRRGALSAAAAVPYDAGPDAGFPDAAADAGPDAGADGGTQGAATTARPWTAFYRAAECSGTGVLDSVGSLDLTLDGTVNNLTCATAISGLGSGLAFAGVGDGFTNGFTAGASGMCLTNAAWPGVADEADALFRVIYYESTAQGGNRYIFYGQQDGSNFFQTIHQSTTNDTFTWRVGANSTARAHTDTIGTGIWVIVDFFYDASADTVIVCENNNCQSTVGTDVGAMPSGFAWGFSASFNCALPITNMTYAGFGIALNGDASWWTTAAHLADCQALGICP